MKLKIALSATTLFFVLSIAFIPMMILSSVTKVNIVPVKEQTYQNVIHCNGEIVEKRVKEIYLETPVIAKSVRVEVGDRVRRGQLLATIDTDLTQTVLAQGATAKNLDADVAAMDVGGIAEKYGLSESDVLLAMNQYSTTGAGQKTSGFVPNEITAPMDGIVTAVNLQTDVLTKTTKPVLVVSDDRAYSVRVSVSESDVTQITQGDRAIVSGVGFAGQQYYATVTKIYPVARKIINGAAQQTIVDVELSIDNADGRLKPGFSAKAVIASEESGKMLTVPYEAVQQDEGNREYVYVYNNNHVQKRLVKTGSELTSSVEIQDGLVLSDMVVINPENVKDTDRLSYAVKQSGEAL